MRLWYFFFAVVFVLGIYFRIDDLGDRPLHHDESIHATFALNWYNNPSANFYKYDPTYHGPFLYLFERGVYEIFGVSIESARLMPLVFGLIVLILPFLFMPWLNIWQASFASALLAMSPHFAYYARFLAHDMPVIVFCSVFVAGLMQWYRLQKSRWSYLWLALAASSFGFLFSVKLVSHLWVFILLSFVLLRYAVQWSVPPRIDKKAILVLLVALLLSTLCYAVVQTALFQHPAGFLDGLYRTAVAHWWQQHEVERIKGPVWYHLRGMALLEWTVMITIAYFIVKNLKEQLWGVIALSILGIMFLFTVPHPWLLEARLPTWLLEILGIFKIKKSPDLFLFSLAFVAGILLTAKFIREKKVFLAFVNYWTFSSLAIYSYIGEKVPWLTTHIIFPACILAGMTVADIWRSFAVAQNDGKGRRIPLIFATSLIILTILQFRLCYIVNKVNAGQPDDLLSQVHNHEDVKRVLNLMAIQAQMENTPPDKFPFAVIGKPVWAFYFYLLMQGHANYKIRVQDLTGAERIVVLGKEEHDQLLTKLTEQKYKLAEMQNEGWWVPEYGNLTWGDWFRYAWTRKPRVGVGGTKMYVFYK